MALTTVVCGMCMLLFLGYWRLCVYICVSLYVSLPQLYVCVSWYVLLPQGIFNSLDRAGQLVEQTIEQLYSEAAGKFLADRFVTGTCPKCQYEVHIHS